MTVPELDPETTERLRTQARQLVAELVQHGPHSPEFRRQAAAVQALGSAAQARAARSVPAPPAHTAEWPGALAELRGLIGALIPPKPSWWARLRRREPPALSPERYAALTAQAGPLVEQLYRQQDTLRRQQLSLSHEVLELEGRLRELEQALTLAAELDRLLTASLPELEHRQPLHAAAVREEVLFVVRGRQTDLTAALATAVQARLALDLTRQQAAELEQGLERAAAGTVTALKLAQQAARAAALRQQAAAAGARLAQAEQDLAQADTPAELDSALAQALAALEDLQRAERLAREQRQQN